MCVCVPIKVQKPTHVNRAPGDMDRVAFYKFPPKRQRNNFLSYPQKVRKYRYKIILVPIFLLQPYKDNFMMTLMFTNLFHFIPNFIIK